MSPGLAIAVAWDGRRVTRADVAINRPEAARLLLGRSPAEVIEWVPRLYSLCGKAQGSAARLALAAARGEFARPEAAMTRMLAAEQLQEHLWRLLRDWPVLLDVAPRDAEFANWFRRLGGIDESVGKDLVAYVENEILGMPMSAWWACAERDSIVRWARSSSAYAAQLVAALLLSPPGPTAGPCLDPALTAADFSATNWNGDFARWPIWRSGPAETGAYARWCAHPLCVAVGRGLLGRLLARLLDLVAATRRFVDADNESPLADASSPADNVGVAKIDTARGMLLHRVELAADKVAAYTVVAPTEWNFHPAGAFATAVASLVGEGESEDELRRQVQRWVVAFDPCVEWTLELHRA